MEGFHFAVGDKTARIFFIFFHIINVVSYILYVYVHTSICTYIATCVRICDLLCQNPPLTHTMSVNSFHCQWIAPSIN